MSETNYLLTVTPTPELVINNHTGACVGFSQDCDTFMGTTVASTCVLYSNDWPWWVVHVINILQVPAQL